MAVKERVAKDDAQFAQFLHAHYSSQTFLCVLFGLIMYTIMTFAAMVRMYANRAMTPVLWVCVIVPGVLLFAAIASMTYVWINKPNYDRNDECKMANVKSNKNVHMVQSMCPVLVAVALSMIVFVEILLGSTNMDGTLLAQSGLKVFPLLMFYVVRDVKPGSLVIAWVLCVTSLFALAIYARCPDRFSAALSYTCTIIAMTYDSHRQDKMVFALIARLRGALEENERLAVEAQALELRAMIGNVAHDLKTPLTSLLSGIECMAEEVAAWQQSLQAGTLSAASDFVTQAQERLLCLSSCLKNMRSCNSFMTMTINRCIDYTKASKGVKLVPKMETTCVGRKIQMPVDLMLTVQNEIPIKVNPLDPAICTHIITDKQWLLENLLCLLSNAVKYSHKGTVEVGVRLVEGKQGEGEDLQPQPMLRFEVQDTGIGLSEEAMQTLFNPFKQAQRLAGGTGLGLFSLAKRVEALQGQYGVCKRRDGAQGSLFWFTIPYRPDQQSAAVLASDGSRSDDDHPVDAQPAQQTVVRCSSYCAEDPLHALVVDDAPLIVKMTTMLLGRKGHSVESAVNGAAALEKLLQGYETIQQQNGDEEGTAPARCTPYDVVLMDLQMPVLDGIETVRRLRAAEREMQSHVADLPPVSGVDSVVLDGAHHSSQHQHHTHHHQLVISLSANSDEETRQSALEAGADAFMPKPFTYENFVMTMKQLSHQRRYESRD